MSINTLYIMTGLPYSGKTTLTRELVKRFGFVAVSVDIVMDREKMWRKGHPTQNDWNEAYSMVYDDIEEYLKQGKSVVFDCGNLPFHERKTPRLIAQSLGITAKLIFIKVEVEELLNRRNKNIITKERGQLSEKQMKTAIEMFEKPTEKENPIIYDPKMDLDEWLKKNIL